MGLSTDGYENAGLWLRGMCRGMTGICSSRALHVMDCKSFNSCPPFYIFCMIIRYGSKAKLPLRGLGIVGIGDAKYKPILRAIYVR